MKRIQISLNRILIWFGIVCSVIMLLQCSSKLEDEIQGKWKEVGGTEVMEFFKDGTLKIEDEGTWMEGTYKIDDQRQIKIEIVSVNAFAGPIQAKGTLSDSELTFRLPNGKVHKYIKFK